MKKAVRATAAHSRIMKKPKNPLCKNEPYLHPSNTIFEGCFYAQTKKKTAKNQCFQTHLYLASTAVCGVVSVFGIAGKAYDS